MSTLFPLQVMEIKCFLWPGLISCQSCKSLNHRSQNKFSKGTNQGSHKDGLQQALDQATDKCRNWRGKKKDKLQCRPDLFRETSKPQYCARFLPLTLSGLSMSLREEHLHTAPYCGSKWFYSHLKRSSAPQGKGNKGPVSYTAEQAARRTRRKRYSLKQG